MKPLQVVPDPIVYSGCQWCGSGESLGVIGQYLVCRRCYEGMFR